jgi:hypothetical protein
MRAEDALWRLQHFLLILAGVAFGGTVIELLAAKHTEEPVQWIPFVLCGAGIVAVVAALTRPTQRTLTMVRACMALIALGGAFGIYEHIENNAAFYQEVHQNATVSETIIAALTGRNPLLAPGILALAAVLTVAATIHYPSQSLSDSTSKR